MTPNVPCLSRKQLYVYKTAKTDLSEKLMLFVSLVFNSGRSVRAIGFLTITEIYLFFPSCLDPDQARERRKPILPWLTFRPGQNSRTESRKDVQIVRLSLHQYLRKLLLVQGGSLWNIFWPSGGSFIFMDSRKENVSTKFYSNFCLSNESFTNIQST